MKKAKYYNHRNELVDYTNFMDFTIHLLSIRATRYLCHLQIDNFKNYSDDIANIIYNKIGNYLTNNEAIDAVTEYENSCYLFLCKDNETTIDVLKEIKDIYFDEIKGNITVSIVVAPFALSIDYKSLLNMALDFIDGVKSKGGNAIITVQKIKNESLVEQHLVCGYCKKITDSFMYQYKVLTPDMMLRDSLYKETMILRCNKCEVASLDLKNPIEFNKNVLFGADYFKMLNRKIPDYEKNILLAVIIYLEAEDYLSAGMLMYLYFEKTNKLRAAEYATEYLSKDESFYSKLLLVDIYRKLGVFGEYEKIFKYYIPKTRYQRLILNLEEYKIKNRDGHDLSYATDPMYDHLYKEDTTHENLTGIEAFDGENVDKLHSLYNVPREYNLKTILKHDTNIYAIFVAPYIEVTRIYKILFLGLNDEIELITDINLCNDILNEKETKITDNITTKTYNIGGTLLSAFHINEIDYFELDSLKFRNDKYIYENRLDETIVFIDSLHVSKDAYKLNLDYLLPSKILYDGNINDWVKIRKVGFDRSSYHDEGYQTELYLLDGNEYKLAKDIVIDKAEVVKEYSFYHLGGISSIRFESVKRIEEHVFDKTKLDNFYISNAIEEVKSIPHASNYIEYENGYYYGNENNKYVLMFDYKEKGPNFLVHDECRALFGIIYFKKVENVILNNSKIVQIPVDYFSGIEKVKLTTLPKTLKKIGLRAFFNSKVENLFYDGTYMDFNRIRIDELEWNNIALFEYEVESSPLQDITNLYLLDANGDVSYKGKKYKLYENPIDSSTKLLNFEKALIYMDNSNRNDIKSAYYIQKGMKENEVYAYYLAEKKMMDRDYIQYLKLKEENNPYALATVGTELLSVDDERAVPMLDKSDTAIAKYNLFKYYMEDYDTDKAKKYLNELLEYEFPLIYKEYALEIRRDGPLSMFDLDWEKKLKIIDKAIEYGFAEGYDAKATLYEEGIVVEKDINKAIELYYAVPANRSDFRDIDLIRNYLEINEYEKAYKLCIDYLANNNLLADLPNKYLSRIYANEKSNHYDIIKSLIIKKSLIDSSQCETLLLEIANIYHDKLHDDYMASSYIKFFNEVLDYNDNCIVNYERYSDLIYAFEDYEPVNIDKKDYSKLGLKKLKELKYKEAYDLFVKGALLDQKKCFKQLIYFYFNGIMVEEDRNIVLALEKLENNHYIYKKKVESCVE